MFEILQTICAASRRKSVAGMSHPTAGGWRCEYYIGGIATLSRRERAPGVIERPTSTINRFYKVRTGIIGIPDLYCNKRRLMQTVSRVAMAAAQAKRMGRIGKPWNNSILPGGPLTGAS
jgi:hypothetical protein